MKTILSLAIFIVIGFIASRGLFTRVRGKLPVTVLFLTGIEFFFLGVLLGPGFLDLISERVLEDLTPVAYLALGWAGLLFGIQMSWTHIRRLSRGVFKFLLIDGLTSGVVCAVAFFFCVRVLFPAATFAEVASSTVVLSITAVISSPTIVAVLSWMLPSRGRFTSTARIATSLSALIPLFGFGLLFTIVHPGLFAGSGFLNGFLWWAFANAVGVVMGAVFVLLTLQKTPRDERLLVIMGTAIFVGGLCYFLRLSALYTSMIMGIVVANSSSRRVQIFEQLLSMEKTLYVAFLILLGAMVSFTGPQLAVLLAAYVVLRLLLKVTVSSWAIGSSFAEFAGMGRKSGLALSAQGGMALAIALDYGLGTSGELVETMVAVVALAVVLNEFAGVVLTRRAFIASGEVKPRKAAPFEKPGPG